eukprot:6866405-Heterocapsa_arctica.AAC.1
MLCSFPALYTDWLGLLERASSNRARTPGDLGHATPLAASLSYGQQPVEQPGYYYYYYCYY